MAILTVEEIIEATGGELLSENSKAFKGVSIDSRSISEGDLFFAIRGERFDGHDFLEEALAKGGGAVVDKKPGSLPEGKVIICVNDTLRSLQDLAHFLRMKRDIPVIAVTGSNGKTTTKEMIHLILSRKFKALKNEGNLNNHIGLSLSLTRLEPDVEVIVLEMGMNAAGEIRRLCEIAVPSHGVITNIGSAHVGRLGSYDAVRDAKLEILEGLSVAVVNADDGFLMKGIDRVGDFDGQMVTFGIHTAKEGVFLSGGKRHIFHVRALDVRIMEKGSDFILEIDNRDSIPVRLNVHGIFNIYNALAAAAVSFSIGMSIDDIRAGLEEYRAFPMRFEVIQRHGITVINDSYNANPSSMEEALRELVRLGAGSRVVAVLGDMRELLEFSEDEHRALGRAVSKMGVDVFIAVGEKMGFAAEESIKSRGKDAKPEVFVFRDADEVRGNIMGILKKGDTVLIKGSRSMSMEKVIEGINAL